MEGEVSGLKAKVTRDSNRSYDKAKTMGHGGLHDPSRETLNADGKDPRFSESDSKSTLFDW